jgi:hypothetical protein
MKAPSMRARATFFMVHRLVLSTRSNSRHVTVRFGPSAVNHQAVNMRVESTDRTSTNRGERHHAAVWQARLIMLVMINIAQLWILAATVDAALARHYSVLVPLVIASGVCFLITLSIIRWWRPTSRWKTSSGYVRSSIKNQ